MVINLSYIDVVFTELSIAAIGCDSSECVDPNDYDAIRALYRRTLIPWYHRLLPERRQDLINALVYAARFDATRIIENVIANHPHLPFAGDPGQPTKLLDGLLEELAGNDDVAAIDPSSARVFEDRSKANNLLEGMARDASYDTSLEAKAKEVRKRFFGE